MDFYVGGTWCPCKRAESCQDHAHRIAGGGDDAGCDGDYGDGDGDGDGDDKDCRVGQLTTLDGNGDSCGDGDGDREVLVGPL